MKRSAYRVKRCVIEMTEFVFCGLYMIVMVILRRRYRKTVLYYHSIQQEDIKQFHKQMQFLARHFTVVSFTELMNITPQQGKTYVAVTFDDGFMSVVKNAWPILKPLNIKATMFVPASYLGQNPGWEIAEQHKKDRREVVIDQLRMRQLDAEGFEMLSHTLTHPILTQIEPEEQYRQLLDSRIELERLLDHQVKSVSYPLGFHDQQVIRAAREAGYTYGVTVEPLTVDCSPEPLRIGRFIVKPGMSRIIVYLKASGAYQAATHLRMIKKILLSSLRL